MQEKATQDYKELLTSVWQTIGSPHVSNLLSLATLVVTIYLTLYIFNYTKQQEIATVETSVTIVPTKYDNNGQYWDVNIDLHNSGPADIVTSLLFIQTVHSEQIQLVGFEHKNWIAMAAEPIWQEPAPTPLPDTYDFAISIASFEAGDNYAVRLTFFVKSDTSIILENEWSSLGIREVTDVESGGHYYDTSQVESDSYKRFISNFIQSIGLTGQNSRLTGDLPSN